MNDREVLDRLDEYARHLRRRVFDRRDKKAPYTNILSMQLTNTQGKIIRLMVRMAEDRPTNDNDDDNEQEGVV
jgi:hypothetical protein